MNVMRRLIPIVVFAAVMTPFARAAAQAPAPFSGPGQAGPVRYAFFDDPNGVRIEIVTHVR